MSFTLGSGSPGVRPSGLSKTRLRDQVHVSHLLLMAILSEECALRILGLISCRMAVTRARVTELQVVQFDSLGLRALPGFEAACVAPFGEEPRPRGAEAGLGLGAAGTLLRPDMYSLIFLWISEL